MQSEVDVEQKLPIFLHGLADVEHCLYFKCVEKAFCEIYEISLRDEKKALELHDLFNRVNVPGITKNILEKSGIECCINDVYLKECQGSDYEMGNELLLPSIRVDKFIMIDESIEEIEKEFNIKLNSLDDVLKIAEFYVADRIKKKAVALKIGVAYVRSLQTRSVTYEEAYEQWDRLEEKSDEDFTALQDFMFHYMIGLAQKHNIPIQIHTGIQEGNGNNLQNSNPLNLNSIFSSYEDVVFDMLHAGFPFGLEAGVMAKMFPNVYVNLAWGHILNSNYFTGLIEQYIEMLPKNKMSGFGGDYFFAEGVYGHVALAKHNIATALANKVDEGYMSKEQAVQYARCLLVENPKKIYSLG